MQTYNKFMTNFWLVVTILIVVTVSYFGFTEGFQRWSYYYVFALITLLMFVVRRWMLKRMQRHLAFLEEQNKTSSEKQG